MLIVETKFKYKEDLQALDLDVIEHLIIHHTASKTATPEQIHEWHLQKNDGTIGFAYNEYIRKDGTVYIGRGFNVGAHTTGFNRVSYGICLEGNFNEEEPTIEQLISLKARINYLKTLAKKLKKVGQHKEYTNTSCAGRNFSLDLLNKTDTQTDPVIKNIDEALSILYTNQVITSINYHKESIKFYTNQERLLINMANCILKLRGGM
jgi:hypothetical protein